MKGIMTKPYPASTVVCLIGIVALTLSGEAAEKKITPEQQEFFESKIRPVLVDSCYECHSADSKAKADLYVDSKAGLLTGGDSGPSIKPGDPGSSLLIERIKSAIDPMPPSGEALSPEQIADLETWIRMGAPDP